VLNFLHQKAGHAAAVETLLTLESAENISIIRITDSQFASGKAYFERYQRLSLVDALTVAYMKDLSITRIYSFDSDFDGIEGITRLVHPTWE
jgi:predicted nucleic acid-binding protein